MLIVGEKRNDQSYVSVSVIHAARSDQHRSAERLLNSV